MCYLSTASNIADRILLPITPKKISCQSDVKFLSKNVQLILQLKSVGSNIHTVDYAWCVSAYTTLFTADISNCFHSKAIA